MKASRQGSQQDRGSTWTRAKRDLSTRSGSSLIKVIVLAGAASIAIDQIGKRLNIPHVVLYSAIIILDIAIIVVIAVKMAAMNRQAAEKKEAAYREKFDVDREALRNVVDRKKSGGNIQKNEKR